MMSWSALAVGAAALVAFVNTTSSQFSWDDRGAILTNMDVRTDATPIESLLYHDFWGINLTSPHSHKSFRPVTVASFRLNYALHGLHPHGFHLVNVLLHAAVSMLVVCAGQALCDDATSTAPLVAGLLFAVHPIHCDSVASVVGRADVLCTAFSLLALLSFSQGLRCRQEQQLQRLIWTLLAITMIFWATLAKEVGFTMFAVLVAMEWSKHSLVTAHSFVVLAAGSVFLAWRVWMNGSSTLYQWTIYENEFAHLPLGLSKALSYAHVHSLYVWKLLWPRHLCYDYGWKTIEVVSSVYDARNLGSAIAYISVITAIVASAKRRRTKPVFVMVALGVCPFAPASHVLFPIGTVLAERLLYLPSVGFCLLVGWGVDVVVAAATPSAKAQILCLIGAVLIVATLRTMTRNMDWYNEGTLFRSALHVAPTSVKVLTNVGKEVLPTNPSTAVAYLAHAVALMPTYSLAHLNLAGGYAALHRPLHAMHHLVHSIELVPDPKAYTSLGQHLVEFWESNAGVGQGTLQTAARLVHRALGQGISYPSVHYGHAKVAYALGNMDDTLRSLDMTRQRNADVMARGFDLADVVDPCLVDTLTGLAWERTNSTTAAVFYISFLTLHVSTVSIIVSATFFNCAPLVNNAAACLHRLGRTAEAVTLLKAATQLHPTHAVLWSNAGYMAESLGRHDDALMFFEGALSLQPNLLHVRAQVQQLARLHHPSQVE